LVLIIFLNDKGPSMNEEKLKRMVTEINSLEKQVEEVVSQQKELREMLSQKRSEKTQYDYDDLALENKIKALGFFKFKERGTLKAERKELQSCRWRCTDVIHEIVKKDDALTNKVGELKEKILKTQQEKELFQKEEELKELAASGNAQAQFDLAGMCFKAKNKSLALEWLHKAAEQGHAPAKAMVLQIKQDEERVRLASYDITLW